VVVPVLAALLTGEHGFQREFLDDGAPRSLWAPRDGTIQSRAAELLGEMGSEAESAVPALELALKDPDNAVRAHAALALQKLRRAKCCT
jgi:HEAT repeat protein